MLVVIDATASRGEAVPLMVRVLLHQLQVASGLQVFILPGAPPKHLPFTTPTLLGLK